MKYEGKDNYGKPKADYLESISVMDDAELFDETKNKIWLSAYGNSGRRNSGDWNSCDNESGFFNSSQPDQIRVFNKYCKLSVWRAAKKPSFLCFEIKDGDYKKSFQAAFSNATAEEIEQLKLLPNFDADVFFEISGIRL